MAHHRFAVTGFVLVGILSLAGTSTAADTAERLDEEHVDRTDFRAIGRVIAPWGHRIGDLRFETQGAFGKGTTVDALAKELRLALHYPEGAMG